LLPCDHYLLTFTLPHPLRVVARRHPRVVYAALLREAAAAVQTLAADRQWVGGRVGILAVLHTWSRTLEYHPHAHLLVTAGGLTPDGAAWITPGHARFLMPGYALSGVFRAKLRAALARAGLLDAVDPRVWHRRWTVHLQPVGRGAHAVLYLSRYIYRVALTDERIERVTDDRVTFRYTHARTGATRRVTLPVDRFLERFLQHVLPRGFPKVRSYGLLSPGRRQALDRARRILDPHEDPHERPRAAPAIGPPGASVPVPSSAVARAAGHDPVALVATWCTLLVGALARRCPACARGQLVLETLPRSRGPRPPRAPP
jgi:hypothetical protein